MGIVFKSLEGTMIEQADRLGFLAFNNKSEYEALIVSLKNALVLGVKDLVINCDSQLPSNQLTREYAVRNQRMESYMKLAQKLFKSFNLPYI